MQCPHCDATLMMTDRQGIEIDYCPKCRGVWLDRGELDKIIERATGDLSAQPQPRSASAREYEGRGYGRPEQGQANYRHGSEHHHDKYRKKKSLLGELFDF